MVEKFQLICERSWISSLIISIQMAGVLLGTLLGGQIADSLGRKPTFLAVLCGQILIGTGSGFVQSWQLFAAFRFLIGGFSGAQIVTSFTYTLEHIGEHHRLKVKPIGTGPIAQIWFSLLAYLIPNWRTLSIVISVQSTLAIPILLFVVSESPRWLVTHGRLDDAKIVLDRIARINNRPALSNKNLARLFRSKNYGSVEQTEPKKDKNYSFWHLFSTRKLAIYSLVMGLNWFSASVISYGLNFNVKNLFGNPQLILAAFGFFGWIAMLFALLLDRMFARIGRKFILIYSFAGPLLCFFIVVMFLIITHPSSNQLGTGMTVLVVLGDAINQGVWLVVYQLSAELFPTVIRNMAGGFCSAVARLGAIICPYIGDSGTYWAPLPYLVLAVLTAASLVLSVFFLDETKGRPLPETIEEMEQQPKIRRPKGPKF